MESALPERERPPGQPPLAYLDPAFLGSDDARAVRILSEYGAELDAVVLLHAHIDHSGALPLLHKKGYEAPVYCSPATRDLAQAVLSGLLRSRHIYSDVHAPRMGEPLRLL
jgi:Cft2 family RNA processing exonuclease